MPLALFKQEVNKQDFTFEGIWRWSVIKFITLIRGYSYLISLEIIVGCSKLKISRYPGQVMCVLEKPDIMYSSRNS